MSAVEALDKLVSQRLHPALVTGGLRRGGRTWWAGDAASGWTLLAVARWKYNDKDRAQFSVETVVWPAGTWTVYTELHPGSARASFPLVDMNAPLSAGPRELVPQRYGRRDWPWKIQVRPSDDLADAVVGYCLDYALPFAREQLDVDTALRSLTQEPRRWGPLTRVWALIYACGMLEHAAPNHPEFSATVTALRDRWVADPRPAYLRAVLQRWCDKVDAELAAG